MEKRRENSDHHHHHHHRKKHRKNKALQLTLIIILCLLILAAMGVVTFMIIKNIGAKNLQQQATTTAPVMTMQNANTEDEAQSEQEEEQLEEGQIIYKGQKYQYNSDIMSFVIMGIDTMDTVDKLIASKVNGGQSDMNFIALMNPHTKKIQLIAINRNLMTTIYKYTADGTFAGTEYAQITLQHAYGSGGADSCEMMVSAIDNVMYMIPIHGYFAMNMGAIAKLNDAIGGVELTALEDIKKDNTNIKKGEKVTLIGKDAFWYTKYRDWTVAGSADARLSRQKQYLYAFVNKLKKMVKNDISLPLDLYNIVSAYSVTDISLDKVTYLASIAMNYSFDMEDIYSVPGETVTSETEYEEFYVDEEALYEMIVEIFYEPVD